MDLPDEEGGDDINSDEILKQSLTVIERDGWAQGEYYQCDEIAGDDRWEARRSAPVCSVGAIARAVSGDASNVDATYATEASKAVKRLGESILALVGEGFYSRSRYHRLTDTGRVQVFNDDERTSKEDVLLAFKGALGGG